MNTFNISTFMRTIITVVLVCCVQQISCMQLNPKYVKALTMIREGNDNYEQLRDHLETCEDWEVEDAQKWAKMTCESVKDKERKDQARNAEEITVGAGGSALCGLVGGFGLLLLHAGANAPSIPSMLPGILAGPALMAVGGWLGRESVDTFLRGLFYKKHLQKLQTRNDIHQAIINQRLATLERQRQKIEDEKSSVR